MPLLTRPSLCHFYLFIYLCRQLSPNWIASVINLTCTYCHWRTAQIGRHNFFSSSNYFFLSYLFIHIHFFQCIFFWGFHLWALSSRCLDVHHVNQVSIYPWCGQCVHITPLYGIDWRLYDAVEANYYVIQRSIWWTYCTQPFIVINTWHHRTTFTNI